MSEEEPPVPRRSVLFFHNVIPVRKTYKEVVKEKLEIGKFPGTIAGIIKVCALVLLLAAFALFLGITTCTDTEDWYQYLFPCSLGITILIQLGFYLIFTYGLTVNNPGKWVTFDIILNLLLAVLSIISSVLTITGCSRADDLQSIPGPLGIVGGVGTVIGCAALFLLYRYVEDEQTEQRPRSRGSNDQGRKSLVV